MADAAKTEKPQGGDKPAEKPARGKKALPTNCVQCNKRIRRKNWYYRNGKYFCGVQCSKTHAQKLQQDKEKTKAAEAAKPSEGEAAAPPGAPAGGGSA